MRSPAHPLLVVLPGGKPRGSPQAPARRPALRVLPGGRGTARAKALSEAVEAARLMRQEIERRIARALETLERS